MTWRGFVLASLMVGVVVVRTASAQTPPAQTPPAQTPTAQPPAAPATAGAPSAAGRWEGSIEIPGQPLSISIDIVPKSGGGWEGTITIPAQNLKAYPLANVTVAGSNVTISMKAPGDPMFTGKLDAAGRTLSGDFSQGGGTLAFSLTRTGDAKIEPPIPSTAIAKELEGTWEGTLEAGGKSLRLVLRLANGADGLAKGTIVSVDQGGVEIPVQTVIQKDAHLSLKIPMIAGSYEGDVKDNTMTGTWSQGPGSLPLVFKKAAK